MASAHALLQCGPILYFYGLVCIYGLNLSVHLSAHSEGFQLVTLVFSLTEIQQLIEFDIIYINLWYTHY